MSGSAGSGPLILTGQQAVPRATTDPVPFLPNSASPNPHFPQGGFPHYAANGGGDILDRFASLIRTIGARYAPPLRPNVGAGGPFNTHGQVNPAKGNLVLQIAPPPGGVFDLLPVLTYNID